MVSLLVVDDNEDILEYLEFLLKEIVDGFYIAKSGEDAIEVIKNNEIDMVISDIEMPDIDGLSLFYHIQKLNTSLWFAFMSGMVIEEMELPDKKIAVIQKPIDSKELIKIVKIAKSYIQIEKLSR